MEREIVVRGTGEARALPDLASLRVETTADHKTREGAHEARAQLAAQVDAVLAEHRNAIGRTTIAASWLRPRTRWHRGEDVQTGWRANRTTFVEVIVLDALGEIMTGVVEAGSTVQGPEWHMAPTNPAFDQARRAAALDARHRAESYAEALGLQLGPVAWVAEPGMRDGADVPVAANRVEPTAVAGAEAVGSDPGEPAEDLTPAELTVEATVEVGFRIL
ncbi:MAG TPA: SIMPL domain-containing protein [Acidimicrobiales bacterium]|nr:SIMPL domain-containing protein [Acidimicrobiales bacterium]